MRTALALVLLSACGGGELQVAHGFEGCIDFNPDDPPEQRLVVEEDGSDVYVVHDGDFRPADAEFDPDLSLDGRVLEVREYWTDGAEAETCFRAWIAFEAPPRGHFQVWWYEGDAASPAEIAEFDVE